jgi:hypothetical protein
MEGRARKNAKYERERDKIQRERERERAMTGRRRVQWEETKGRRREARRDERNNKRLFETGEQSREREREREEFPGNRGTTIIEKPTSVSISPATFWIQFGTLVWNSWQTVPRNGNRLPALRLFRQVGTFKLPWDIWKHPGHWLQSGFGIITRQNWSYKPPELV